MKKLLAITLLLLLCVACVAEGGDLPGLARDRGFEPVVAPSDTDVACCDLAISGGADATLTWTDAAQCFTVSGDTAALSQLYLEALSLGDWQACLYSVDGEAQFSYGVDSTNRCDTLEAYATQVRNALDLLSSAVGLTGVTRDYVLNKRSKKFHYPDCSGIANMNPKNREDFTGTREALIADGYSPCGICKP